MPGFLLTFFGLAGWTGTEAEWNPAASAGVALGAGLAAMLFVAMLMRFFQRMGSSAAEAERLAKQVADGVNAELEALRNPDQPIRGTAA